MNLADLLRQRREKIVDHWFDTVARSYPEGGYKHLAGQQDRFQNPVGHTFRRCLPVLFAALIDEADETALAEAISDIVKIRTVQCERPSQAIAFVFLLKNVIREELVDELIRPELAEPLRELEASVDGLALMTFDELARCREMIYEIRTQEVKRRSAKLVEQVNRIYDEKVDPFTNEEEDTEDAGNL